MAQAALDMRIDTAGSFRAASGRMAAMGAAARRFKALGIYTLAHEIRAITDAALDVETPEISGNLKGHTAGVVRPWPAGAIISWETTVPYARFVWQGTGVYAGHSEYDIVPNAKRALYWTGAAHPVRGVHRVGNKPNNYPLRSVERALPAQLVACRTVGRVLWFGVRP